MEKQISKNEWIAILKKVKNVLSPNEYSKLYQVLNDHKIIDNIESEVNDVYVYPSWYEVLSLWKDSDSRLSR